MRCDGRCSSERHCFDLLFTSHTCSLSFAFSLVRYHDCGCAEGVDAELWWGEDEKSESAAFFSFFSSTAKIQTRVMPVVDKAFFFTLFFHRRSVCSNAGAEEKAKGNSGSLGCRLSFLFLAKRARRAPPRGPSCQRQPPPEAAGARGRPKRRREEFSFSFEFGRQTFHGPFAAAPAVLPRPAFDRCSFSAR